MPGLPGAKIRKVMDEIWLRLLAAFWGRVNEPQISQPTANSSCSKTPRSSYGRQAGAAGGYQDLVGRCSASSPADDTSRFGAAPLEAYLRPDQRVVPSCPLCNLGDPPECQHTAAVRLRELRDIGLRQRDRGAIRLICRDLAVGWRRHRSFARKGCLDRWPQLRKLPRLSLGFVLSELRHDFRGKEFESFADVFVPVLPALLDKYRLVHTRILESAQRLAQFRGRADASGAPAEHLSAELITHRQIAVPDVGATERVLAEDIVMGQCKLKEAEAIRASTPSLFRVGVARKAGDHGDVRVDGVTDRHAFTSECFIVFRYPVPSLRRINEGKGERADP